MRGRLESPIIPQSESSLPPFFTQPQNQEILDEAISIPRQ